MSQLKLTDGVLFNHGGLVDESVPHADGGVVIEVDIYVRLPY